MMRDFLELQIDAQALPTPQLPAGALIVRGGQFAPMDRAPEITNTRVALKTRTDRSEYTPELGDLICDRLAEGRTLRDVCRDRDIPVNERSVRRWAMNPRNPFAEQFELARTIGLLSMAEEMLEIADDSTNDWGEREGRRGVKVRMLDYEHIERAKVRIETRKWILSKALPKMFGRHLPARPEGDAAQLKPLMTILQYMNSNLGRLVGAWNRVERGERLASHEQGFLLTLYKQIGCPSFEDVVGPEIAREIERERLLERYEKARLAYAGSDDENDRPDRKHAQITPETGSADKAA